jgi:hypothetical protein
MEKMFEEIISGVYKSPIEIIVGQAISEFEDGVYKAVQDYGVNVDKEELIRALQYDRGQYEKGYADGLSHRETEWISVEERLPAEDVRVLVWLRKDHKTTYTRIDTDRRLNGVWVRWYESVTHWMPLPSAPK